MNAQEKLDLYALHKEEYKALSSPALIHTKPAHYLSVAGQGAPGGAMFEDRVGALYGVAYTIKMTRKFSKRNLQDYAVCKLEGQWWTDGGGERFALTPRDEWRWNLMIRTPDFIENADVEQARATLLKKGKAASVAEVGLKVVDEGPCVQMLHVGPYEQEIATVAQMETFMKDHDLKVNGLHHEIYLNDPRRMPPEKLKTIIRLPVRHK